MPTTVPQRSRSLLLVAVLTAMLSLAVLLGAFAAPAGAQTCTADGMPWGASYAWAVIPPPVNNDIGQAIPFDATGTQCYAVGETGTQSIGADKTHSRTFNSGEFIPMYYCDYISDTNWVSVSFGGTYGSGTATATNWNAEDGHSWALGAQFFQNESGQSASAPIDAYTLIQSSCANDYGCPKQSWASCANGYAGASHHVLRATTRSAAMPRRVVVAPDPIGLTPITKSYTAVGTYTLQCPHGQFIANVDAATSSPATGPLEGAFVDHGLRAAKVHIVSLPTGEKATAQLVCRRDAAKLYADKKLQWGVKGDTTMASTAKGQQIFAGAGDNRVTTSHSSVTVFGGFGSDTVVLGKLRSVAVGGVGDDALTDNSGSSILEGGLGADTLTSSKGQTRINAVDGSGNDTIICKAGSKAAVVMDKGDTVQGTCGSIRILRGAHA